LGSGIPEDAGQSVLWRKAGKAIRVPKSFVFSHEKFIALFFNPLQDIKAAKIKGYLTF
jgi:hypothetical protein